MYYPKNKIKPNQYTSGGVYYTLKGNVNWIGFYFETFDGKIFAGKTIGVGTNEELIKSTKKQTEYKTIGNELYTDFLKKDNSVVQLLSQYIIPKSSIPQPTEEDYKAGLFTRYFLSRINDENIMEINSVLFNDVMQGSKYNSSLYAVVSLNWRIRGSLESTLSNGILVKGVRGKNEQMVIIKNGKLKGLDKYLTNFSEFYKE
tara:strand:+ start:214 stop:819 length:606 start_codon:yes stop_codon:yes gene_type:complete